MAKRPEKQLGRLCEAVIASLLPFLEATLMPLPLQQLTREAEWRLLLALSRVSKAIRGWVEEQQLGCGLDQEIVACSGEIYNCCFQPDQAFDDGFSCLANIVSILVGFLGFCSEYVKQSAGNILIALSSALIKKLFGLSLLSWSGPLYWKHQPMLVVLHPLQLIPLVVLPKAQFMVPLLWKVSIMT